MDCIEAEWAFMGASMAFSGLVWLYYTVQENSMDL